MRRILDNGLDELAAIAHQGAPLRVIITCLVAVAATSLLPAAICLSWLGAMALAEIWAVFTTRRQARGETVGPAGRAHYAVTLFVVAAGWMVLGGVLWTTGIPGAAISAVPIPARRSGKVSPNFSRYRRTRTPSTAVSPVTSYASPTTARPRGPYSRWKRSRIGAA